MSFMARVQDPLTDLPSPSRLDFEELRNFLRLMLLLLLHQLHLMGYQHRTLQPHLLFITSSPSGVHLIHHLPGKLLLCSVVLSTEDYSDKGSSKGSARCGNRSSLAE
ncbi:hypothetical protein L7F22_009077 [Adiantum nelumboides]|nr:hypothetical protein [Adiantum nelumboides]